MHRLAMQGPMQPALPPLDAGRATLGTQVADAPAVALSFCFSGAQPRQGKASRDAYIGRPWVLDSSAPHAAATFHSTLSAGAGPWLGSPEARAHYQSVRIGELVD
ncbi:hypothetical protein DL764_006122 [Monosporascus ibericus]|uniref:Uncharacterized protein n=1 Tax=Monosporascus ibericus TaxID=155417 RepID=A0A4V1XA71_9PEZI|nr:hypothetical protein DL764_006122 [Monosporascus ibericus]